MALRRAFRRFPAAMLDHKYALPVRQRLRQYTVMRLLGHGGFGLTYLAEDTNLLRRVAVKELLPVDFAIRDEDRLTVVARSGAQEENLAWALQRFVEEGRTLAALHHPSILPIYDIFEENGTAYLITAYIEGHDLESWLRGKRHVTEKEMRDFTLALLAALTLVHSRGYLHRDIKPENILMESGKDQPVLIDFGNARVATGEKTLSMTSVLTKGYAPFEQYSTRGRQGPWTDLYALGAVLFRAITGAAPDDAADRVEEDKLPILADNPPPDYSWEFLATVDKALRVRREDRWQNCQEWIEALSSGSTTKGPWEPPRPSPVPHPIKPPQEKKPRGLFFYLVLSLVAVLVLTGVIFFGLIQEPTPTPSTPTPIPTPKPTLTLPTPTPRPTATPPTPTPTPTPATLIPVPKPKARLGDATKDNPYVNTLGMSFVPVTANGITLYFCKHETRIGDYNAYLHKNYASWEQSDETQRRPVVNVTLKDAKAFCQWLNDKRTLEEAKAFEYDLPTDKEWTRAVGVKKDANGNEVPITSWEEALPGSSDGKTLSPADGGPLSLTGLYHLRDNVKEWCKDSNENSAINLIENVSVRGGSYTRKTATPAVREQRQNYSPRDDIGFRCIIKKL